MTRVSAILDNIKDKPQDGETFNRGCYSTPPCFASAIASRSTLDVADVIGEDQHEPCIERGASRSEARAALPPASRRLRPGR